MDEKEVPSEHAHPEQPDPELHERVRDTPSRSEPEASLVQGEGSSGGSTAPDRASQEPLVGLEGAVEQQLAHWLEVTAGTSYSGPMLAGQIAEYDHLVPGSAEKIIHAQFIAPSQRQSDLVQAEVDTSKRGQGWAIALALICVVASIVFFAVGNPIAGGAFLGLPLVVLIGSFLPWSKKG